MCHVPRPNDDFVFATPLASVPPNNFALRTQLLTRLTINVAGSVGIQHVRAAMTALVMLAVKETFGTKALRQFVRVELFAATRAGQTIIAILSGQIILRTGKRRFGKIVAGNFLRRLAEVQRKFCGEKFCVTDHFSATFQIVGDGLHEVTGFVTAKIFQRTDDNQQIPCAGKGDVQACGVRKIFRRRMRPRGAVNHNIRLVALEGVNRVYGNVRKSFGAQPPMQFFVLTFVRRNDGDSSRKIFAEPLEQVDRNLNLALVVGAAFLAARQVVLLLAVSVVAVHVQEEYIAAEEHRKFFIAIRCAGKLPAIKQAADHIANRCRHTELNVEHTFVVVGTSFVKLFKQARREKSVAAVLVDDVADV